MSVFTSTNLGVNKTNPAHTLDVNGDCGISSNLNVSGRSYLGTGFQTRTGTTGTYGSNAINLNWNGSKLQFFVDSTDVTNTLTTGSAPTTQSLILSYTMNSVFSNGTTKPMYVTLVINASALNEVFTIYCDTNSNPSTQILQISVYSNQQAVSFVLLPNFYFKVNANASGSVTSFIYYN